MDETWFGVSQIWFGLSRMMRHSGTAQSEMIARESVSASSAYFGPNKSGVAAIFIVISGYRFLKSEITPPVISNA